MQLKQGTFLQGGKYKIKCMLGQGGFGITYLAEHTLLKKQVAIKEFFMKELCNRDKETSLVSIGSEGSREMVEKFREKFLKEARNIARLKHPNIVSVIDVFEENGTAYYVMEYCENGSLSLLIKTKYPSGMPETLAKKYVREVASALEYVHKRSINHLDVKPANLMLNEANEIVLIDFGLAKQYDAETGQQTSSTPIGISEGYAPMEQYKKGGVGQFSPATDIYSLGATLYKLITGLTPPSAPDLGEEGLPEFSASIPIKKAICSAMAHRRADRPQSIADFLACMDSDPEMTVIDKKPEPKLAPKPQSSPKPSKNKAIIIGISAAVIVMGCIVLLNGIARGKDTPTESGFVEDEFVESDGSEMESLISDFQKTYIPDDFIIVPSGILKRYEDFDASSGKESCIDLKLDSFYICTHEVTQKEFLEVMGNNPSSLKGDSLPVNNLSYKEAVIYCNIRSTNEGYSGFYDINGETVKINHEGNGYRLPTKYEWVFASRMKDGTKTKYAGGNDIGEIAWYGGNSKNTIHKVATKKPNDRGIYDLCGNVYEYVWAKMNNCNCVMGSSFSSYIGFYETDMWGDESVGEKNGMRVVLVTQNILNNNTRYLDSLKMHASR